MEAQEEFQSKPLKKNPKICNEVSTCVCNYVVHWIYQKDMFSELHELEIIVANHHGNCKKYPAA